MAKNSPEQIGRKSSDLPFQVRVLNVQVTDDTKGHLSGAVTIAISPPKSGLTLSYPFEDMPSLDDAAVASIRSLREWAQGVFRAAEEALSGN